MEWKTHCYRVGSHSDYRDDLPADPEELAKYTSSARKAIEPWLSAVFQAEHLNLLLGSGFTTAIARVAGMTATDMSTVEFGSKYDEAINSHAKVTARRMLRGRENIEDQLRSALAVLAGLEVTDEREASQLRAAIDARLSAFLASLLATERAIASGCDCTAREAAKAVLQSFLLSFASRAASRERLHIFTTNYDRVVEHGCDLAGLRILDRFVGALSPVFRTARVEIDVHYSPPGIRGEPRYLEGVIRLTKLHGSLDWHFDRDAKCIRRSGIPFGAPDGHTDLPNDPVNTVMIYPNPAKDVETTEYPYAELFRDFAAAVCRPNAVVVTYGYAVWPPYSGENAPLANPRAALRGFPHATNGWAVTRPSANAA